MALDYTGTPNGLFVQLGKIVKHYFAQKTDATDLDADLTEILNVFEAMTSGKPALMTEGFATGVQGWQDQHTARRATLVALATTRLQDRVTVLDQIGATSTDIAEILTKLLLDMNTQAQSVDQSTVTIGTVTADAINVGNGTVLVTTTLDAVTSPGVGAAGTFAPHSLYKGVASELCVTSETMRLRCSADSFVDSTGEGNESFTWEGRMADVANGYLNEGSGLIGSVVPINGTTSNILTNGDFETWAGSPLAPTGWDIVAGVAAVNIVEETNAGDYYHGASGLKLVGNGVLSPEITQDISASLITGNKRYCVACRIKADAAVAAGTLTIQFEGTGYTAGGTEKITVAFGALPTSWTLKNFFVTMPEIIPSDFRLVVRWGSTPTNTKRLWIDDLAFAPVTYGGGLGVVVVRGSAPFTRDDAFSWTVANDDVSPFQKFARQAFGVQLISASGAGETIPNSLTS